MIIAKFNPGINAGHVVIPTDTCTHPIEQRVNCSRGDGVNIRRGEHTQCMVCSKFSFQFKTTQE